MKKTKILIEIETDFKKVTEKDFDEKSESRFDLTKELEEDFHNAVFEVVENIIFLKDIELGFEESVLSEMNGDLPKDVGTFDELGKVRISVSKVGIHKLSEYSQCTCANGLHDGKRIDCNCKIHHQE